MLALGALHYVCMCWQAGVTSGFHEGLGRLRAAKYSTEGIRGNLLIREKKESISGAVIVNGDGAYLKDYQHPCRSNTSRQAVAL